MGFRRPSKNHRRRCYHSISKTYCYVSQKIKIMIVGLLNIITYWLTHDSLTYYVCIYTVGELKDLTNCSVWSKTTLITSSVGRAKLDPPSCKTGTFFLRSLTLSVPIYRNFQSNGGKWRSHKLWMKKFI